MTMWDFVSDEWQCPSAETDLRVGGKLKARMEAKDGSFGFDFEAIYNEVVPRKRLVFTLADGRRTEVDFTKEKKYVRLTVNFDMLRERPHHAKKCVDNNFRKLPQICRESGINQLKVSPSTTKSD